MANGQAYGIEVRGLPGLDTVSIGGVPGIKSVSVGAIKTTRMNNGLLGLRNITNQMYLQRLIPSPSWSYNPGSDDGRRPPQLVFGGYDPTKYLPGSRQNHSMEVASNGGPTMQVTLDRLFLNITGPEKKKTFATNSSLLGESINVIIDSSTPFCWLPRNVTDRIAQSVGAVWNATLGTTGYYVYNTSQPAFENRVNATLAFHVDGAGDTWLFNSITVSQSLFLVPPTANVPADSKLNYLPLMPVDNADTYVLGRSFLQQMYLMANYHTMQFSLSQINLNSQSKAQYIKIDAPAPPVPSAPSSQPPPERPKSKSLSGSAIAGIAIGLVIVVGLLLGVILWYTRKRLWGRKPVPTPPEADDVLKKDGVYYKELSAENLGEQGRMIPSVEPHTPTQPSLSQPPVEVPAADSPVAQELPAPPN
ncbi:Candidapepsin-1 [Drechslerella dactyloides]|uniref:Candidapepsin-1 n=1 Tax=Drechslerella dactyloides TaxID=74499 RepID=A0AAD6J4G5_DREDA|nr:Candidapepsin-1 [Drechslerella dactyloides]